MKVEVRHSLTGQMVGRDLPVTEEQLARWRAGELVQDVFPFLSVDDREWLVSGLDSEEWEALMADEEEDEFVNDDGWGDER